MLFSICTLVCCAFFLNFCHIMSSWFCLAYAHWFVVPCLFLSYDALLVSCTLFIFVISGVTEEFSIYVCIFVRCALFHLDHIMGSWCSLAYVHWLVVLVIFCHLMRSRCSLVMMTSSSGNIFRVTGPLCGEFTGNRWIPRTKMFSLICAWINGWVNNCEVGDLRRHRAHYDIIVMV